MRMPAWWGWELRLDNHVLGRMEDRDFTEIDLRSMLHSVSSVRRHELPERWIVRSRWKRQLWNVILELDHERQEIVVVTAYRVHS